MATFYFLSWGFLGNLDRLIMELNWEHAIPEDSSQCCSLKKKGVFLETSQGLAMLSGFCVLWVLLAIRFKSRAGDLVVGTKTDFTVGSDINQTLEVNNSSELLLVFPPHLHNWYKLVCDLLGVRNVLSQVLLQIR